VIFSLNKVHLIGLKTFDDESPSAFDDGILGQNFLVIDDQRNVSVLVSLWSVNAARKGGSNV